MKFLVTTNTEEKVVEAIDFVDLVCFVLTIEELQEIVSVRRCD